MHLFHENLKNLRIKNNLTQDQLADIIGVSRQAISKWERGDGLPDLHNIQLLSKALNVSVDELIGNSEINDKATNDNNRQSNNTENSAQTVGGWFKKLIYGANNVSNSEEAKKVRKKLLTYGVIGVIAGGLMVIIGIIGFISGGFGGASSGSPSAAILGITISMLMFTLGGTIAGLSVYLLYAGISIVVVGVTTKYFDSTKYCPNCDSKIDGNEKNCAKCGTRLVKKCSCGTINNLEDIYCRECGKKID